MKSLLLNFHLLRTRLLLLTALTLCPVFLLALNAYLQQRKIEQARVRQDTLASSRLAAVSQKNYFEKTHQLLTTLAQIPLLTDAGDRNSVEWHFRNLRNLSPDYVNFGIIERDGKMFCNALVTNPIISLADRSCFQKVLQTRRFAVGDLQLDTLVEEPCINFGYPVLAANGELKRVLFASLKLSLLSDALGEIPRERGEVMLIFDPIGHIIASQPSELAVSSEEALSLQSAVKAAQSKFQNTFEHRDADDVWRLYAITPITDAVAGNFLAIVGVPRDAIFAGANGAFVHNLILMGIIAVLALLAGRFFAQRILVRPVQSLIAAANRLARGDFSARSGVAPGKGELAELGKAFDSMAGDLETRQNELKAASAEIQRMNAELEQRVQQRTAELEASNQELESFSHSVSHDLRAPLRHLAGFSDLLWKKSYETMDGSSQRYLTQIKKSADRMGMLIDDLLSFARMGRKDLHNDEVDFNKMVREIIAETPADSGKKIEWVIMPLSPVRGDTAMLRQVWANLIGNGVKYTGATEHPRIEIGWREEPDKSLTFFIKDNGAGFDMKYAHKLFGVFQRLHGDDEFQGTGIGLANVRRIIHRHGGRTWAEGQPGKGATFYFSLLKNG